MVTKQEVKLKVAEAVQDDVNKGIVRIDSTYMHKIGLRPGDVVHIHGQRKTVAIVDRAYPGDIGLNIIRMDGLTRRNARSSIGEFVEITKADVQEAKHVTIAPSQKGISINAPPVIFKQGLLGQAVLQGDIVSLGGSRKRRTMMSQNPFFSDIFSIMDDNLGGFGFGELKFIVTQTDPKQAAVIITENTHIEFNPEAAELKEGQSAPEVSYEDIGGLSEEIKKVRELIELPLKHPEIFDQLGIEPPKGVLLHGPPGTGKTLLAKAVANETNSNFLLINGPEIMSKFYGESEANLRKKFEEAEKNAPSIIFIDEIDAIAPAREESKGEVERRVVAQLLTMMDGLQSRGKVVVIAATNIPNAIDPALRRPGRFDRELEINPPSKDGRLSVLKIHTRNMPIDTTIGNSAHTKKDIISTIDNNLENIDLHAIANIMLQAKETTHENKKSTIHDIAKVVMKAQQHTLLPENYKIFLFRRIAGDLYASAIGKSTAPQIVDQLVERLQTLKTEKKLAEILDDAIKEKMLEEVAEVTHGFVGADLAALSRETAMVVLRKVLPELSLEKDEAIPQELLDKLKIGQSDFHEALRHVRPSAMREVMIEVPNTAWKDVGGLDSIKQKLQEAVEWPLNNPEAFARMGVKPPKGILLYGPPGTGKTMLAKAVANESKANFISVKGPELLSKWVGESEKAVRKVFTKARQLAPAIIFFDEIDAIAPRRGNSESTVTERVVNQLLTEIDGLESLSDVVVIAATNRPDIIDPALLRPGRFDRIILTPVPDEAMRQQILQLHTRGVPLGSDVNIKELASKMQGYVGADIEAVAREAAILALREDIKSAQVLQKHFIEALKTVRPSVNAEVEKAYKDLEGQFSSAQAKQIADKPAYFG
ncbi:MAG: CDC48 family AAA ATPase [Candidatus Woesearchaeota archaeon]